MPKNLLKEKLHKEQRTPILLYFYYIEHDACSNDIFIRVSLALVSHQSLEVINLIYQMFKPAREA